MSLWMYELLIASLMLCMSISQSAVTSDKTHLASDAKPSELELFLYSPEDADRLEGGDVDKRANVFRYGKRAPAVFRYGKRAPSVFRYGKRSLLSDLEQEALLADSNPSKRIFRYGKRSNLLEAWNDFHNSASHPGLDKRIFRYGKRLDGDLQELDDTSRNGLIVEENSPDKDLLVY